MLSHRPFASLGAFRNGWLNARHHFSFGEYHDPARANVGRLRVWNDDEVAPGSGFPPHPHRDMEIITYVRAGAITHEDDLGNKGVTKAGDVQVMHAGTGIVHAEYNREAVPTRLFQIWIVPDARGAAPGWGTRAFPAATGGGLTLLASGRAQDAARGALALHADAAVLAGRLAAGERVEHRLGAGRAAYLVPAAGRLKVGDIVLNERDGLAVTGEDGIAIEALEAAEIVLVDILE